MSSTKSKKPLTFPTTRQSAEEFKRGIKQVKAHYTPLKESKQWDDWRRSTLATTRSHYCGEIVNPTYKSKTSEEKDLFIEKQKIIYSVFDESFLTDTSKSLVRSYDLFFDTQHVYHLL